MEQGSKKGFAQYGSPGAGTTSLLNVDKVHHTPMRRWTACFLQSTEKGRRTSCPFFPLIARRQSGLQKGFVMKCSAAFPLGLL